MPDQTADAIARDAVVAAVTARLTSQLTGVLRYDLEAVDVPLIPGSGSRVQPYYVLTPFPGGPSGEDDLADTLVDIEFSCQITCVAAEVGDLMSLVTRVDAAMLRWSATIPGLGCGRFRPPPGYQPPTLLDRTVTPHRPYVPLQYGARVFSAA